jgi:N-acetyl-anhydromuramyl-L-alanine amidase AmpD
MKGDDGIEITEEAYDWAYPLVMRRLTDCIVLHHEAASGFTAQEIHSVHLARGWSGIGYHYYVRKDGSVYRGRPEEASGAHTEDENYHTVGICFEGNFETEAMGDLQLAAGRALIADIRSRYAGIDVKRHSDYSATACPGKYFPFTEMVKEDDDMTGEEIYEKLCGYLREQPCPDWAQAELQEAVDAGITDGTRPCELIPRYQAAIMAKRAKQG